MDFSKNSVFQIQGSTPPGYEASAIQTLAYYTQKGFFVVGVWQTDDGVTLYQLIHKENFEIKNVQPGREELVREFMGAK